MNMARRKIKWAAAGFVGGFLLCYLLIGAFQSPRAPSRLMARVTAPPAFPPVPTVQVTNIALPQLRIQSPPRWPGSGVPPASPHPGYSLDLIDTHAEIRNPPENR